MSLTRVMLEYVHPWPNHAGLFLARRNGGFARLGLDVDLVSDGYDRGGAPEVLARGECDVASLRLGHVLQSRTTGTPFVAVATLNQRQLGAVITTPDTGITRFADLEGKTIAVPPVPRLIHEVCQAVAADGGDADRVRFADPGNWEPDVRAVEQGLYDAVMNVRAWEPFQGNTPPEEVVILEFDSVGVAPHHSYFLSVRQDLLERNPEFVRAFLAGTERGYREAMDDEDAAVEAMSWPMCHVNPSVLRASLRAIRDSWFTPEGRWGQIQEHLVTTYTEWMESGGWLEEGSSIESLKGAWTNAFLP